MDRLADFMNRVRDAPTDPFAESVVRIMLEEVAKDCPMPVLVRLGQCLVECRQDELRDVAERN